ncbi:MAG: hypothetical protein ABI323_05875 [Solirubrobacteraceae bacterium]
MWRTLPPERRLAAIAAVGLILTLFLPWYQETVIARGLRANLNAVSASLTGWGAFSFVEAAVLLVAAGVLVLLFVRAEGAAFHVPGGDGGVLTAAGVWTCLLIIWRMFDKEGTTGHGLYETTSGIEWGIFIALGVAALLVYAGSRVKLAHEPEPPLHAESRTGRRPPRPARTSPQPAPAAAGAPVAPGRRERVRPSSLADWTPKGDERPRKAPDEAEPTRVLPSSEARERRRTEGRAPHRALDLSELERIEFDDPPEAPRVARRQPDPEDPLGTRPDRPD